MFPSRITPNTLPTPPLEQGESSQSQARPSTSSAQQIAQHLQQSSGQNSTFEATLGDGAQPVRHIVAENIRAEQLSNVLQAWVDQLPPSMKNTGQNLASSLQRIPSNITILNLSVHIGDTLPDIFPFFTALERIYLMMPLRTLPESLGLLKDLRILTLNAYAFQAFPQSLTQLINLDSLILLNAQTLPPLPLGSDNLSNLTIMHITGCRGENALPANTHLLPNLKQIYFSQCSTLGDALQQLQTSKHLQHLTFHLTPIGTEEFYQIKALKALNSLEIITPMSITQLPEDLFPMPNLTELSLEQSDLVQIPESISRQTKLTTLNLRINNSLASLPDSMGQLQHLQTLYLTACSSLTHLPESIVDLPGTCEIQMEGTGLSVNVLQQLSRQTELRRQSSNGQCGPTIYFSLPPSATEGSIGTFQEEALKWMHEAGSRKAIPPKAKEHIAQLNQDSAKALATLLARFRHTAQYEHAPMNTAQRIHTMLKELFAYPKLLDSFCAMALESTTTCDDRTALGMLHMELALLEHRLIRAIRKDPSREHAFDAIKQVGLGVFKQKLLMDFAHEHAKQAKGFVDETEIVLKFLTNLGKKLALPTQLDHMLYARFAWQVKSEDLDNAEHQITEQANLDHPAFLDFLASWHPMQEALTKHMPKLLCDIQNQCDDIDTATLETLEQQNTAYETACEQHGEESPQALDWQAKINQTNQTRQTKRAAVWRAAIREALNEPDRNDQAGPSNKPKLDPSA